MAMYSYYTALPMTVFPAMITSVSQHYIKCNMHIENAKRLESLL